MGKPTGFMEYPKKSVPYRDARERLRDFREIFTEPIEDHLRNQGARCMDCGVPFCQSDNGCPIDNLIPEWNDLVYQGRWRGARAARKRTLRFTGPPAPAPSEGACVLGITIRPSRSRNIETLIDSGFAEGWVCGNLPQARAGRAGVSGPDPRPGAADR